MINQKTNESKKEDILIPSARLDEDMVAWDCLAQVRHAIYKARIKELSLYNIANRSSMVLWVIRVLGDKATPSEIAKRLLREPHSVSEYLDRMENSGLIRKVRDLKKKSMVRIEITEKGLDVYKKTAKADSIHRIMSALSKKERQQLISFLEKLWDKALEELGLEYRPPHFLQY